MSRRRVWKGRGLRRSDSGDARVHLWAGGNDMGGGTSRGWILTPQSPPGRARVLWGDWAQGTEGVLSRQNPSRHRGCRGEGLEGALRAQDGHLTAAARRNAQGDPARSVQSPAPSQPHPPAPSSVQAARRGPRESEALGGLLPLGSDALVSTPPPEIAGPLPLWATPLTYPTPFPPAPASALSARKASVQSPPYLV